MEMSLERIGTRLKKGELIIYPTDTVYGVGGVLKEDTLKKIYEAKTRSFSSPLIALVNSLDKVDEIAIISDEHREKINKLIKRFWPGGLTIILKKRENVPAIMVSNGETVGVRMPNHKLALDIIESAGGILATTSANISGEATPSSFVEISPIFKERVDIVIDGGKCPIGTASTIIDMSKSKISILREGSISKEEIENIIGKI